MQVGRPSQTAGARSRCPDTDSPHLFQKPPGLAVGAALAQVLVEVRPEGSADVDTAQPDVQQLAVRHGRQFGRGFTVPAPCQERGDLTRQPGSNPALARHPRRGSRRKQVRLFPLGIDIAHAWQFKRELGVSGVSAHSEFPFRPKSVASPGWRRACGS
jgi:hypothetical protein